MNVKKAKVIAIIAAVAAAGLMLLFIKTVQDGQLKYVAVLEAAQQVNKGDAMNSVNFTQANIEETSVAPGAVFASDVESIKNMYAAADIYAGEQITRQRLTNEQPSADDIEDSASLADSIPDGMRTFTMTVSQPTQSASNMVRPGDTVDILAYYTDAEEKSTTDAQETKEKYVADALTVAAVDQYTESQEKAAQQAAQANNTDMGAAETQESDTQGTGTDGTAQSGTQSSSASQTDASQSGQGAQAQDTSGTGSSTAQITSYATVTMIVTPDQAKQLNYLQNYGATLTLTLRGKDDKADADHGEFKFEGVSGL